MTAATQTDTVTLEQICPVDQARLVVRLALKVEGGAAARSRQPLRELLADLGKAPSAEEIDEIQREMW